MRRPATSGVILKASHLGSITASAEAEAVERWYTNPISEASAHAVVGADGLVTQMVPDDYIAWHSGGELNARYLGVTLVQPFAGDPITDLQYRALAKLIRDYARLYGFAPSEETVLELGETKAARRWGPLYDLGPAFDKRHLIDLVEGLA